MIFLPLVHLDINPPTIGGKETDFDEIAEGLTVAKKLIVQVSTERDSVKKYR